jgi:hypothetical protein
VSDEEEPSAESEDQHEQNTRDHSVEGGVWIIDTADQSGTYGVPTGRHGVLSTAVSEFRFGGADKNLDYFWEEVVCVFV